jgi:ribosomal protein L29
MKRSVLAELRGKSVDELNKMTLELREQIFRDRMAATVAGKSQSKVRQNRRQVARIQTLIAESQAKSTSKPAAKAAVKKSPVKQNKVKA